MKRVIQATLLGLLLLFGITSQAAVDARTLTTASGYALLSTGGYQIDSVVVATDTNMVLRLYNTADTNLLEITESYTNWTQTITNYVRTWITSTGITNSVTNVVKLITLEEVAAATNAAAPVKTYAAPAGTVTTFADPFVVSRGLFVSNDVGGTVIINYRGM